MVLAIPSYRRYVTGLKTQENSASVRRRTFSTASVRHSPSRGRAGMSGFPRSRRLLRDVDTTGHRHKWTLIRIYAYPPPLSLNVQRPLDSRRRPGGTLGWLDAVGMRARAGQLASIHDQILLADRTTFKPAFQDLPGPGGITSLCGQ